MTPRALLLLATVVALPFPAAAEEGMWTFDDFPAETVKKAYGVSIDRAWLDRVRLGSLRLGNGCSASIVGAEGLVMTNHHCIRSCIEDLSVDGHDYLETGFYADSRAGELRCPKLEVSQLVQITDVTARVLDATKGASGADYQSRLKVELARLESECSKGDANKRCDVITLFHGARFHLYEYRRHRDLRLVFAPEFASAIFGGYPDNFNFPRYSFDVAFLRIYDGDRPRATPERLRFAARGVKEGDLVFTSGHPGGTERDQTIAQLELQRDVVLPWTIDLLGEDRGRLSEWMKLGPDRARIAKASLRSIENALKALRGRRDALVVPGFLDSRRAAEEELKAKAPEHTKLAWTAIASAMETKRSLWAPFQMKEAGQAFESKLFGYARALVRRTAEVAKPNAERLREHTDAQWPATEQLLLARAPIYPELEVARLTWSLSRARDVFGADDPFIKAILGPKSPEELAAELIAGTKLADHAFRKSVLEHPALGERDVMIAFAKSVDAEARAIRKRMEDEVDAVVKKNAELLAEAKRAVLGTTGYPDATSTLRLSYGKVAGTQSAPAMTFVAGLFARATGRPPFALVPRWEAMRGKLDPQLPFDLTTTNDIIGGNSGSPLVDRRGDVAGLIFDGNLASLGGRYGYDGRDNRAIAVHAQLILTALKQVYGARALAAELEDKR